MVVQRMGIPQPGQFVEWTGHCIRIGACSDATAVDVPDRVAMSRVGHREMKTTDGYTRRGVQPARSADIIYGGDSARGRDKLLG